MTVKAIVRDNIIMPDGILADHDLKALNCYFESFAFEIDTNMRLDDMFKYATNIIKPYIKHMRCDHIELVAV